MIVAAPRVVTKVFALVFTHYFNTTAALLIDNLKLIPQKDENLFYRQA
jgi:hypothetical protein